MPQPSEHRQQANTLPEVFINLSKLEAQSFGDESSDSDSPSNSDVFGHAIISAIEQLYEERYQAE
jgi:hypothetical protein